MSQIIAGLYELKAQIGSGGGGVVYLGRHLRLDKDIVLKADKRQLTVGTEALRREVDMLKSLSHTYIPQVYDFVQENDVIYTVMEYIEGQSLDKLLGDEPAASQCQVIKWAYQLLQALCYLHSQPPYGILHGDIKPANIMLRPNGDICLIDFNIALALGEDGAVKVGYSRGYASPEHYGAEYISRSRADAAANQKRAGQEQKLLQSNIHSDTAKQESDETLKSDRYADLDDTAVSADREELDETLTQKDSIHQMRSPIAVSGKSTSRREGILLDVRSDIYSLAATLYHLLSGVRPAQDARDVVPLGAEVCSLAVSAILQKAMSPEPENRYQTAAEMLDAFVQLHKKDPRAVQHRRRIRISAGVLSAAFFLGGGITFIGQRQLKQIQEAYAMSEYSANALAEGDISGAVRLALQAISGERGFFDAPVVSQAQLALTEALGVYSLEDGFRALDILELPGAPFSLAVSPENTRFAVVYGFEAAVYSLESMERIAVLPVQESAFSGCTFLDEGHIVYSGRQGVELYDLDRQEALWTGRAGTTLAVSADGKRAAAVDRYDDSFVIYSVEDGAELLAMNFNGQHMAVPANDIFANPADDIFTLNRDGSILAVSFENGGLVLLDIENPELALTVYESSEYRSFWGGFQGDFFVFTAEGDSGAVFGLVDVTGNAEPMFLQSEDPFLLQAGDGGIYLAEGNTLVNVKLNQGAEEFITEKELARTEHANITAFSVGEKYVLAAADDNSFSFYDGGAKSSFRKTAEENCDFVAMAGEYAIVGSRNSPSLRLLKLESHEEAQLLSYDARYRHSEARISQDGKSAMLFDYEGFRIYGMDGKLIAEQELPDAENIYDQQFVKEEGGSRLEVIWYDGTRRHYSAADGTLLTEEKGEAPEKDLAEEFYTEQYHIVSGLHSAPEVYGRKSGKLAAVLEQDSYLAYVTEVGEYILTEYVSTSDERYGILLDRDLQKLAVLPGLCDVAGDKLVFDYGSGDLRQCKIYSLEELVEMGEAVLQGNLD